MAVLEHMEFHSSLQLLFIIMTEILRLRIIIDEEDCRLVSITNIWGDNLTNDILSIITF